MTMVVRTIERYNDTGCGSIDAVVAADVADYFIVACCRAYFSSGSFFFFVLLYFLFFVRIQTFTRFVEIGRVVLINYGDNKGKLATVIDVVDSKRVRRDYDQFSFGLEYATSSLPRVSTDASSLLSPCETGIG